MSGYGFSEDETKPDFTAPLNVHDALIQVYIESRMPPEEMATLRTLVEEHNGSLQEKLQDPEIKKRFDPLYRAFVDVVPRFSAVDFVPSWMDQRTTSPVIVAAAVPHLAEIEPHYETNNRNNDKIKPQKKQQQNFDKKARRREFRQYGHCRRQTKNK